MDMSNKTLGLLLVAAIVVSIGGTFFSLEKLDGFSNTGYVEYDSGSVNLSINSTMSIKLNDSTIDFGTCTITGFMTFDSNNTAISENNSNCNGTFPDYMTVENDGNILANISVAAGTTIAEEYLTAPGLFRDFKASNGASGGCGTPTSAWTTFDDTASYTMCQNLATTDGTDQVDFFVRIGLPSTATSPDGSTVLTFTASTP